MDNIATPEEEKKLDSGSEKFRKTMGSDMLKFDFPFDLNNLFSL